MIWLLVFCWSLVCQPFQLWLLHVRLKKFVFFRTKSQDWIWIWIILIIVPILGKGPFTMTSAEIWQKLSPPPSSPRKYVLKLILKVPDLSHLGPIWPKLDAKFDIPDLFIGLEQSTELYLYTASLSKHLDGWRGGCVGVVCLSFILIIIENYNNKCRIHSAVDRSTKILY